jgi:NTE family protein
MAAVVPDTRPVDEIRFEHLKRVNPQAALAVMETKPGEPIDQTTLDADLRRLYGTGDFEHVNYRLIEEPNRRVLAVDAVEKSWGPNYVRLGLGLSSDFSGDAYFNLLVSHRQTWLDSRGAEWRTDLQIGRTSSLYTEYYQPFDAAGRFFVAPHAILERRSTTLFQGDHRIARYDMRSLLAGVDFGSQFARYGELRIGVEGGTLTPSLDTGPQSLSPGDDSVAQGAFKLRLVLDQADSVHFPRDGWRVVAHVFDSNDLLGADDPYTKWLVEGTAVYSFGEHTFNIAGRAGGRIGSHPLPRYDQFQWGGFLNQSGYATGQLVGQRLTFGRLLYYHRILRGTLFEGAYGGISLEAGKVREPLVPGNPDGLLKSVAVFVAADSPVGPAYLGYGLAQDGNNSVYFFLGRAF